MQPFSSELTFEDTDKASAVAALDLSWVSHELEWVQQQLCPSDDPTNGNQPDASNGHEPSHDTSVDGRSRRLLLDVVLSHNDLLSGNVLHAEGWDRVQVIPHDPSCSVETLVLEKKLKR